MDEKNMARVKLQLPEKFIFSTEIQVRISDINYGGHLGNDSLLSIIHEARLRFLKNYNYSEIDVEGTGIILSDSVIVYKSEGFYGDILTVQVTVDDFNRHGCDIFYKLINKKTGKEVALAKTGIVFFDYNERKIACVPEKFKILF
jgi:acyl-CoA thioester hydrolase